MKVWNSIFNRKAYRGNEPDFYPTADFSWTQDLESNWREIREELAIHLSSNSGLNPSTKEQQVNHHGSWKTMPLKTWGVEFHRNIQNFPVTAKILEEIPGLVSASFNLLEKNSEIKQHFGETNASVRAHLGLYIPRDLPQVGIKVNGTSRSWEEGKILIFCDGYEHSAWNYTEDDRYILLLDIIRPEFLSKKRSICGNVLATLSLQTVTSKSNLLFYTTFIPISILHFFAKISAISLTPVYNRAGRKRFKK